VKRYFEAGFLSVVFIESVKHGRFTSFLISDFEKAWCINFRGLMKEDATEHGLEIGEQIFS
jgi:hypothetical protein